MDYASWYVVPILICVASISLVKILPQTINGWLEWMGSISAALFVCHPITRKIFIPISRHGDIYTGLLLYIIASIGVAWLFKQIISKIPNPKKIA
jgi:peptidoglycan/LPS O-acetylase OafA/YrhL